MNLSALYGQLARVWRAKSGRTRTDCFTRSWRVDVRTIDSWSKLARLYAKRGRL